MKPSTEQPRVKLQPKRKPTLFYPIQAEVEYVLRRGRRVIETGRGQTIKLSGNEVVLEAARPLPSGMAIQVTVAWPGPLGKSGELRIRIAGRTGESQGNRAVVHIDHYDFEARSAASGKPLKASNAVNVPHAAPLAS